MVVAYRSAVGWIEPRERSRRRGVLLAVDHERRCAGDHEEQLFLVAFCFIVLGDRPAGWNLDEVDAERLAVKRPAHERPATRLLELVAVRDRVPVSMLHLLSASYIIKGRAVPARAAERELEPAVLDHECVGDELLARSLMPGNHARERLAALVPVSDSNADAIAYPQSLAAPRVIDRDLDRSYRHKLAGLPRHGK
jgi:hypothetical protein